MEQRDEIKNARLETFIPKQLEKLAFGQCENSRGF